MTTDDIKTLLGKYYPNAESVSKIVCAKYHDGMLFIKFNDGQRVMYCVEDGQIFSYKFNKPVSQEDNLRLKSVFREMKLTTIIDE